MNEPQLQDLLSAFTDALLRNDDEAERLLERAVLPREASSLVSLTRRLHSSITPVEPSAAFSRRLKADLMGQERQSLVWHWRQLPARVHIAAILALFGGFGLLVVGGIADVLRRQHNKESAAPSTVQ
jgi:hypothetical protein